MVDLEAQGYDELRNLGVTISKEEIQNYMCSIGIKKKFKDLTQSEKIYLRMKIYIDNNK